ncbi:hypothetical protein T10_6504 [Trichinella papuae]|uniref:Uncharacterized protein n=1 Tax=Trichinella papuae TaxID=268474 RepID=A0A0V1MEQ5_9BILA|nr:hypothetical protein T10_6504 [Trichinella papuae]
MTRKKTIAHHDNPSPGSSCTIVLESITNGWGMYKTIAECCLIFNTSFMLLPPPSEIFFHPSPSSFANETMPMCLLCQKFFSNDAMKP